MMPAAIVFDLWYTLICPEDFRRAGVRTIDAIPAVLNLEPEPFHAFWQSRLEEMHRSPRPLTDYIDEYTRSLGRILNERELADFDAVWSFHDQALSAPREDVLVTLKTLRNTGLRFGLLSNAHEREVRDWDSSPLAEYFDGACFSCHIECMKPEPASYAKILELLGVPASDAVFVGDGAYGELAGARAAGFGSAVFMRGFLAEFGVEENMIAGIASEADAVIDRIEDLSAIVER